MNYLAHLYMAGADEDLLVGQMLGDFLRPREVGGCSERVRLGVRLHLKLDAFTDFHPTSLASRRRLRPPLRRWGGVLVDIYYDHFLARRWEEFHPTLPLEEFTARAYRTLQRREAELSVGLRRILPSMAALDWLTSYREMSGVERALRGLSRRVTRANPLAEGGEALRADYEGFERDFSEFFPQAIEFNARAREALVGDMKVR